MQKMLKKKFLLIIIYACYLSLIPMVKVSAWNLNDNHENRNEVRVSKDAYKIIVEAYGQEYFDNMTKSDYVWFEDLFKEGNKVELKSFVTFENNKMGTSHSTNNKKISIIKSCSTSMCTIITTLTWLTNPTIRSYDVIGTRFNGTSLANNSITTRVQSSSGVEYFDNIKQYSNGFGVSVRLPQNATNIIVDQKFYVETKGIVFASYQHATKNISLSTSKLYLLDYSGYGNVFIFYGDAVGVYDQMAGVNITL